jgi:hypothetical protein
LPGIGHDGAKEHLMKKLVVIAAAAVIGVGSVSATPAHARDRGAIAAGVIGGLAVGAIAGAIANSHRAPAYVYVPARRPKVHVYNYYEAPYDSGYYSEDSYSSGYASGYRDGYYDASDDW